jgi:hypothetical protein
VPLGGVSRAIRRASWELCRASVRALVLFQCPSLPCPLLPSPYRCPSVRVIRLPRRTQPLPLSLPARHPAAPSLRAYATVGLACLGIYVRTTRLPHPRRVSGVSSPLRARVIRFPRRTHPLPLSLPAHPPVAPSLRAYATVGLAFLGICVRTTRLLHPRRVPGVSPPLRLLGLGVGFGAI